MSIETAKTPEEALWRQVLLCYAGEIFRIKSDVIKEKRRRQEYDFDLNNYKRSYEYYEFKLQKLKAELYPIDTDGGQKLPLYEVCHFANVNFFKFRQEMLKIIEDERGLPDGSRLHLAKT